MNVPARDGRHGAVGKPHNWALFRSMRFAIPLMLLGFGSPALAAGTSVPEPTSMALFGLGVLGVVVGRRGARRKRD